MHAAVLIFVFALLFGGASAQASTEISLPTAETNARNFSFLDGQQYLLGGRVAGNDTFWGYHEFFFSAPNSLDIVEVSQAPAFGGDTLLFYRANGWAINSTSISAVYGGPAAVTANYSTTTNTTNGTRMEGNFDVYSAGAFAFSGTAQLAPVKYALEVINSKPASASAVPPESVNRTELATTYIIQGNSSGYGNFTGVGYISASPANGVIDNTTVVWQQSLRPDSGAIEVLTATGRTTTPGNFAKIEFTYAGSGTGTFNMAVTEMTSDGPILNGTYHAFIVGANITGSIEAYPVKYALRQVEVPLRRHRVKRIVDFGN